ncbi:VOC family protein [Agrococcus jenensis]|uniref:Methylmalonyl-CoA/ethylmalonyl-CoA epimerase n=1 Tax=Agrococcus jenensis TaxID=46353 RepID=A0A3N2AVC9_9MICO|nr:VOC family protein [Agrococcus jenensis]ROR66940.1 methylmalonyl-CoA/ethylmalonyl-CoA epimerase [Agrococcus jenensis]
MIGDSPLVQVAQRAQDLERAAAFYATLLGTSVAATFDPPGLAFLVLGDTRLLLERGAPSALLYFAVDDLDARVERLRASGVSIVAEPHTIFGHADATLGPVGTEERMAFILDSEGNTVALVEHRRGADA